MKSYQISCRRRKKDGVSDVAHGSGYGPYDSPAHLYIQWCNIAPPTLTYVQWCNIAPPTPKQVLQDLLQMHNMHDLLSAVTRWGVDCGMAVHISGVVSQRKGSVWRCGVILHRDPCSRQPPVASHTWALQRGGCITEADWLRGRLVERWVHYGCGAR